MKKESRLPIWRKMIIVLCCLAVVFTMVFFLREWYPVAKFREFLVESVNTILYNSKSVRYDSPGDIIVESEDFTRIEEDVPFHVPRPGWLPEGYKLEYADYVDFGDDFYNIRYKFINSSDEDITINIVNFMVIDPNGYFVEYEWVDINDEQGILTGTGEGEQLIRVEFMFNQEFLVNISGSDLDREALVKFAESME